MKTEWRDMWNPTIAMITLRSLLGRRRFLAMLLLPLAYVGAAVAVKLNNVGVDQWAKPVILGIGFGVVMPVLTLIVSAGVLGSEVDDGTLVHILTKPLPRSSIILTKYGVAVLVSAAVVCLPMYIVGLMASSVSVAIGLLVGSLVGVAAYSALFLALSMLTKRPVLIGLAYIVVWENILSNVLNGTWVLSIQKYAESIASSISGTLLWKQDLSLPVAISMAVVFIIAGLALAIDRLRSFSVAGETS
jgi:ABC-2 type transport system permease protein